MPRSQNQQSCDLSISSIEQLCHTFVLALAFWKKEVHRVLEAQACQREYI